MQVAPGTPEISEIRRELELVLRSSVFKGSKRCQDFLRFVSLKALEGAGDTLKERTLAVEVFGRQSSTDLSEDSIVRVGAREVRKRLAQYYVTDGARDRVRIDLPAGSYVPTFHLHAAETSGATLTEEVPKPVLPENAALVSPAPVRATSRLLTRALILVLLAAAAGLVLWRLLGQRPTEFDEFWAPAFRRTTPVLIVLPHPIVYHPSSHASRLDLERNGRSNLPVQRPIEVPPQMLDGSDFVPVLDQYVGFGDTLAAMRVATLLAQHAQHPRVRLASKVEFNDLRDSTPILLGAYTNRWTAEITKGMRFRFAYRNQKPVVLDSRKGTVWKLDSKTDNGRSSEDYVLICRLPHAETGGFLMAGAGLTVYGTQEAGRILTDPEALLPILHKLPKNWANENVEFVLHVEVVGDAPTVPALVAVETWK